VEGGAIVGFALPAASTRADHQAEANGVERPAAPGVDDGVPALDLGPR
jgi:hypothetical protein